jgi:hypothetical protein
LCPWKVCMMKNLVTQGLIPFHSPGAPASCIQPHALGL